MSDYYRIMGNNGERRVYTIPVGGLSPKEAEKQLKEMISRYKEDVSFGATFSKHEDYFIPVVEKNGCIMSVEKDGWSHREEKDGFYTHPPQKLNTEVRKPWYKRLFR